jgi:flagellar hook-length control protein FliK
MSLPLISTLEAAVILPTGEMPERAVEGLNPRRGDVQEPPFKQILGANLDAVQAQLSPEDGVIDALMPGNSLPLDGDDLPLEALTGLSVSEPAIPRDLVVAPVVTGQSVIADQPSVIGAPEAVRETVPVVPPVWVASEITPITMSPLPSVITTTTAAATVMAEPKPLLPSPFVLEQVELRTTAATTTPIQTGSPLTSITESQPPLPMQTALNSLLGKAWQDRIPDARIDPVIANIAGDARSPVMPNIMAATAVLIPSTASTGAETAASMERPVGQSGWGEDLGNRIQWMIGKHQQTAQIRLNPTHLGPMEVRVTVKDDQAHVVLIAQNGVVREALDAALPKLREMLAEQGLKLDDADVSERESSEQQNGRMRDKAEQMAGASKGGEQSSSDESDELLTDQGARVLVSDSQVDYFA